MDKDSLIWIRRLLTPGATLSLWCITMNDVEYDLKIVGALLVLSALLFFIDFQANLKFRTLLWTVIPIWVLDIVRRVSIFCGWYDTPSTIFFTSTSLSSVRFHSREYYFAMQCTNLQNNTILKTHLRVGEIQP